jgi:hypothetical protein
MHCSSRAADACDELSPTVVEDIRIIPIMKSPTNLIPDHFIPFEMDMAEEVFKLRNRKIAFRNLQVLFDLKRLFTNVNVHGKE